jgi:hypothetical protein
MADVTTTFAAKDESFASTVDKLNGRLQGFQKDAETFSQKVGNMAKQFAAFVGPIAAVGAAFLGARGIVNSFRDAIDIGGKLNDLSARTGETAGNLAILQRAFENAGSSGEAVGPMLNRLQRFMVEAGEGGKAQAEAMNKLGLSYTELQSKSPTAQMELLAQKISAIPDPAQRSALAMQIFGRSGGELMPLLRSMGAELDTARAQLGAYPEAIDRASKALDDIGDNFAAITTKAREFVTGALVDIAPTIARAADELAKMDFAAMGMNLSQTLTRVYDFFVGLWQRPAQVFGLLGDYLNATFRQAGDSLLSAFLTAGNALMNSFQGMLSGGVFERFGDVMANAFVFATAKLGLKLFDVFETALKFYGQLWAVVTGQGTSELASKLLNVVKFFASDFVQAMTNPAAFIANKVSASLLGATKDAAIGYKFAFDSATGSYIDKAKSGLTFVAREAGANLSQAATGFGAALSEAGRIAAEKTGIVKVNLFGGAEAIAAVNDKVTAIAEAGAKFRLPMQESVEPAEKIGEAIATLPESGKGLKEVLAEAFPLATAIKTETQAMAKEGQMFASSINQAKIDAQVTANVFTGLSDRMNRAVNGTSKMLDQMRESFHFGRETSRETYERMRAGGMDINAATKAAADYTARQNANDIEMRRLETKQRIAEDRYNENLKRAAEMESRNQDISANNLRRRAEAEYTKKLEEIRPALEKGAAEARRLMEESGKLTADSIKKGGEDSGEAVRTGGEDAAKAIKGAAEALKTSINESQAKLALEATLQSCRDFLKSIDKKLPQHALT